MEGGSFIATSGTPRVDTKSAAQQAAEAVGRGLQACGVRSSTRIVVLAITEKRRNLNTGSRTVPGAPVVEPPRVLG